MKSRIMILLLALALATQAPMLTWAQSNGPAQSGSVSGAQEDWQGLRDLKPGKQILVEFKPNIGDPTEGRFVSATGTKLTLTTDGYTRSLEQRDIQSVYRLKGKWSRRTAGRVGAVIGALVGGFVGADIAIRNERGMTDANTLPIAGGLVVGGLAGAGLGRLAGGKRKGELLYEAR